MSLIEQPDLNLRGVVHDLNNVFQTILDAAELLGDRDLAATIAASGADLVLDGEALSMAPPLAMEVEPRPLMLLKPMVTQREGEGDRAAATPPAAAWSPIAARA